MKIQVDMGWWHQGEGHLADRLNLIDSPMILEASTTRQVLEQLKAMTPEADAAFELWFNRSGLLRSSWLVFVNHDSPNARRLKSEAELDAPLQEGERIYITSCV